MNASAPIILLLTKAIRRATRAHLNEVTSDLFGDTPLVESRTRVRAHTTRTGAFVPEHERKVKRRQEQTKVKRAAPKAEAKPAIPPNVKDALDALLSPLKQAASGLAVARKTQANDGGRYAGEYADMHQQDWTARKKRIVDKLATIPAGPNRDAAQAYIDANMPDLSLTDKETSWSRGSAPTGQSKAETKPAAAKSDGRVPWSDVADMVDRHNKVHGAHSPIDHFDVFDHGLDSNADTFDPKEARNAIRSAAKSGKAKLHAEHRNRLMQANGGHALGIEVKNTDPDYEQWGMVLPDASEPGKYRNTRFDKRGFYTHHTHDTPEQALDDLINDGFHQHDPGAMDRLSATKEWEEGMRLNAEIQKHNQSLAKREAKSGAKANAPVKADPPEAAPKPTPVTDSTQSKDWHTAIPEQGMEVQSGDARAPSESIVQRAASEAYEAIARTALERGIAMHMYVLLSSNDRHGAARLLPEDQDLPAGWVLASGRTYRPWFKNKSEVVNDIARDLMRLPLLATGESMGFGPKPAEPPNPDRPMPGAHRAQHAPGSKEGQFEMAARAARLATLSMLNKQAGNVYSQDEIANAHDDHIDGMRDHLIAETKKRKAAETKKRKAEEKVKEESERRKKLEENEALIAERMRSVKSSRVELVVPYTYMGNRSTHNLSGWRFGDFLVHKPIGKTTASQGWSVTHIPSGSAVKSQVTGGIQAAKELAYRASLVGSDPEPGKNNEVSRGYRDKISNVYSDYIRRDPIPPGPPQDKPATAKAKAKPAKDKPSEIRIDKPILLTTGKVDSSAKGARLKDKGGTSQAQAAGGSPMIKITREKVQEMIRSVAESSASPEAKQAAIAAIQAMPVEEEGAAKPATAAESKTNGFNPADQIKIAADSIIKLRRPDVERVLTEGLSNRLQQESVASYIRENRPDLADEVNELMSDPEVLKPDERP